MQKEIKCPQCGGNRFNESGNNSYRCIYCGATFTSKANTEQESTSPVQTPPSPPNINVNINTGQEQHTRPNIPSYQAYRGDKSRTTAGILAIILGDFGAHHFYLRRPGLGILYLIFFWTWIPSIIGLIEGITYLCMRDRDFDQKYNY